MNTYQNNEVEEIKECILESIEDVNEKLSNYGKGDLTELVFMIMDNGFEWNEENIETAVTELLKVAHLL